MRIKFDEIELLLDGQFERRFDFDNTDLPTVFINDTNLSGLGFFDHPILAGCGYAVPPSAVRCEHMDRDPPWIDSPHTNQLEIVRGWWPCLHRKPFPTESPSNWVTEQLGHRSAGDMWCQNSVPERAEGAAQMD